MSTVEPPEVGWSKNYRDPDQVLRILRYFTTYCKLTPAELLDLQREVRKSDDPNVVANKLKDWIMSLKGRRATKLTYVSMIRSFFEHHGEHVTIDKQWIRHKVKSDRTKVEGKVSPEVFDAVIKSVQGDPRKMSMFLTQLQSFSGPRELCIIGNEMGVKVGEAVKNGASLIELHFEEGRKHSENPWYSYLGKDACDALRKWFEVRGYPTADDPYIWPSEKYSKGGDGQYAKQGTPLTESAVRQIFARVTGRLGYRPKVSHHRTNNGAGYSRYGYSIKEIRDLAFSLAQRAVGKTNDAGEHFLESSIEYFGGHTLDPMEYRKIHKLDVDFRKRQYQIVEPYLSPISGSPLASNGKIEAVKREADARMGQLESENKDLKARLERLEALSVERLVLAAGTRKRKSHRKHNRD